MVRRRGGRSPDRAPDIFQRRQADRPDHALVEAASEGVEGLDVDPLGELRLVADEPAQPGAQRVGQGVREGGEQDASVGVPACERHRAVECHDGLPGPRRAGNPGGAREVALDQPSLLGVEEDRPLVPRELESAFEVRDVLDDAEAAQRIRMRERIAARRRGRHRLRGPPARRHFQERLRRLARQPLGEEQHVGLGREPYVGQPLGRDPPR